MRIVEWNLEISALHAHKSVSFEVSEENSTEHFEGQVAERKNSMMIRVMIMAGICSAHPGLRDSLNSQNTLQHGSLSLFFQVKKLKAQGAIL